MKNFKKLLVLSVSALMVFGVASCNNTTPTQSQTPSESESESKVEVANYAQEAADFIFGSMKDTTNRMADFNLAKTHLHWIDDNNSTIVNLVWTLEVKDGGLDGAIAMEDGENNYTVKVKYDAEFSTKATEFVLKCTFTDENGQTASIELPGVVPAFKYATYEEFEKAIKDNPTEVLNVLGTVTAVYKNGPFIVDENGYGFYAYSPAGEATGQAGLFAAYPVGTKVLVSGTATSYNGQSEFAKGCTIKVVEAAPANYEIPYADQTNAFATATSTKDAKALGHLQNTVVEINNVTIQDQDLTNFYYYFTVGDSDVKFYLRTSGSYNDFTNEKVNALVEEWVQGYKANLKGLVQVYNNAYYLTPIELDNAVEITERTLSTEQLIINGITAIDATIEESYSKAAEVALPATDETGIAYTYAVKEGSKGIAVADGKLVVTPAAEDQVGTLVVTGTKDGKTQTVEIVINVAKKGMNILVASELDDFNVDTSANGNKVTGSFYAGGYIKAIANTTYGNMHIVDQNGEDIYLYGLYSADGSTRFDKMTEQPKVGDYIFVASDNITYYNGYQLSNAKMLGNLGSVKVEAGTDTILEAGKDLTTNNQVVEGTYSHKVAGIVTEVANTTYGNLYIEDAEGNSLYVYGLYSADGSTRYDAMTVAPQVGDFVVINVDQISYYNGVQAKSAKLEALYSVEKGTVEVKAEASQEEEEKPGETPVVPTTTTVATFSFGADKAAGSHVDGNAISATKEYTDGSYTLTLTDTSKVYDGGNDLTGKSFLKLGTGSVVGTFKLTAPEGVDYVIINVAQYKANATYVKVNGVEYTISTSSNSGEYTPIYVDVRENKSITFETTSSGKRCVIDSILFATVA